MNSKPFLLAVILLSLKASLFAQTLVGVEGGLSYNTYHTNIANRAATSLTGNSGFTVGIPILYRIYPWLYITAIPGLVQKGYTMNRTDSLAGEYDRHKNTYLQLPVGAHLEYGGRRLRFGLDAGLYAGYWLYGRVKGRTADIFNGTSANGGEQFQLDSYNQSYSFLSERDNRWEEGWWLGPGIQYLLTGYCRVTVAARYYQSLTSQEKTAASAIPAYNRTWTFSIGAAWSIHKSKPRT
ncbi:porin family protein [Dinghuibacter silviterrae]|uniref:Outer membrane protein with beta-barrel domain n=1 Tax=Dinghuibacter silviterrae TaxID=1539049 RepID=A0A4R8DHW4_9BACT|nr:porin family protein [Dinghuibacter silviterrae]TDW96540.1 outer membrane protein with beta-barrel domain [Dinghuibacter silviterrae]